MDNNKKTAQEVPVEEQSMDMSLKYMILQSEAEEIVEDILKLLSNKKVNFSIAYTILDSCKKELGERCFIKI